MDTQSSTVNPTGVKFAYKKVHGTDAPAYFSLFTTLDELKKADKVVASYYVDMLNY